MSPRCATLEKTFYEADTVEFRKHVREAYQIWYKHYCVSFPTEYDRVNAFVEIVLLQKVPYDSFDQEKKKALDRWAKRIQDVGLAAMRKEEWD